MVSEFANLKPAYNVLEFANLKPVYNEPKYANSHICLSSLVIYAMEIKDKLMIFL